MQRVSDTIRYLHNAKDFFLLAYIDDFIGAEEESRVWKAYESLGKTMQDMGAKEAREKRVPPCTRVEFLGMWFDVENMTMSVTADRLAEILLETKLLASTSSITRKDLERIIGKLQFVAACVWLGRVFINRLLNSLRAMEPGKVYHMEPQIRKYLKWWYTFLPTYNGVSLMWLEQFTTPDQVIATDAFLQGAGGIMWGHGYFRFRFPPCWRGKNIAYLELWAVIVALRIWRRGLETKNWCFTVTMKA